MPSFEKIKTTNFNKSLENRSNKVPFFLDVRVPCEIQDRLVKLGMIGKEFRTHARAELPTALPHFRNPKPRTGLLAGPRQATLRLRCFRIQYRNSST